MHFFTANLEMPHCKSREHPRLIDKRSMLAELLGKLSLRSKGALQHPRMDGLEEASEVF